MAAAKGGKSAKVSSKNNPNTRGSKVQMFFQGKEVVPVKFIGSLVGSGVYMAISQADNGDLILDAQGIPYKWDLAQKK
jgi:hypothetical protein